MARPEKAYSPVAMEFSSCPMRSVVMVSSDVREQPGVEAALRQQFLVSSGFHGFAAIQHHDPVRVPDRAEAVRDDHAAAAAAAQIAVDPQFRFRVERAGRLVQQQQGGVRHQRPRDFEPLAFAAAEVAAALAHFRKIAEAARRDLVVDASIARGPLDLRDRDGAVEHGQVVADGAAKQEDILVNHRKGVEKFGVRIVFARFAVESDLTPPRPVQPRDQLRHRGLARTGRADDRDPFARLHRQREVAQHRFGGRVVAERHIAKLQKPLQLRHRPAGAARLRFERVGVLAAGHHVVEPLQPGVDLLQRIAEVHQLFERGEEVAEDQLEHQIRAAGHAAGQNPQRPQPGDQRDGALLHAVREGAEQHGGGLQLLPPEQAPGLKAAPAGKEVVFAAGRFQRFDQHHAGRAGAVEHTGIQLDALAEQLARFELPLEQQQHRRAHHRRQRAEHRVVTEHHHRVEKERDQTEQIGRKLFGEERRDPVVQLHAGRQFAALAAGEEAHRQMQHPVQERRRTRQRHFQIQPHQAAALNPGQKERDQQRQERQRDQRRSPVVEAVHHEVVDENLRQVRREQIARHQQQSGQQQQEKGAAASLQSPPQRAGERGFAPEPPEAFARGDLQQHAAERLIHLLCIHQPGAEGGVVDAVFPPLAPGVDHEVVEVPEKDQRQRVALQPVKLLLNHG